MKRRVVKRWIGGLLLVALGLPTARWGLEWTLARLAGRMAAEVLEVPVSVGDLELHPFAGRVDLVRLRLANPPGYDDGDPLAEVNRLTVRWSLPGLLKKPLVLRTLSVEGLRVTCQQQGLRNNLQEVLGRLHRRAPRGRALVVRRLAVRDTTVSVRWWGPSGSERNWTVTLGTLELQDVGAGQPMDLRDLTRRIFVAAVQRILREVALGDVPDPSESGTGVLDGARREVQRWGERLRRWLGQPESRPAP